jgi:hypothetical protein
LTGAGADRLGFASLGRYWRSAGDTRRRNDDGYRHLTELTDVDLAGRQRGAALVLPGADSQRADDASDQLKAVERPRM